MKNKKVVFFIGVFFAVGFFLTHSVMDVSAAGCCIKDTTKTTLDPNNCVKNTANVATCTGTHSKYLDGDPNCTGNISKSYCDAAYDPSGCCIKDTKDSTKYGTANCVSNKKKSECSGTNSLLEVTSTDCTTLNSSFCKTAGGGESTTIDFPNPINATTANDLFGNLLTSLRGVIAIVAIIFIIIGGVMYMFSAGNEKMMDRAKMTITGAVIGFAIALAAPTFLKELKDVLGGGSGTDPSQIVDNALSVKEIAMKVLKFLLSVVGIFGMIGLIIGGIFYLTAYGDEERIDKGKNILKYSIIGILVALAALVLVRQVASLMGAL